MIGDAVAAGKRGNTYAAGPEFKKKNSKGQSHKHVDGPRASHGGGDHENAKVAKRAHKTGPRPGVNVADRQSPHKQREKKEVKHVNQGQILDEWCSGKRGSYK
ncbi:MAG: hypothetical protein ACLPYS_01730 [Vulcanimicrobiaceae bacterium]